MKKDFLYTKWEMMEGTLKRSYAILYNRDMLVKFQAHINIEWCNMSRSVKYLFKYIHKGVDYVCDILKEKGLRDDQVDEIKIYLEMRYISMIDACWRLFQFDIHYQDPLVERLDFHIENEHQVVFPNSTDIEKIVGKKEFNELNSLSGWRQTKDI
jgi:hypothetical protein